MPSHHHPVQPHHKAHRDPPYVAAFIATLLPIAKTIKTTWRVPIAALIAQGALESSWGRHVQGNAYFGIKGRSPTGNSVTFPTHEEKKGKQVTIQDEFRAYKDMAEAADDYGRFLASNRRYAVCFAYSEQPLLFIDHLAAAGYATDSGYAAKLKSIVRAHHLAEFDKENPLEVPSK